MEMVYTPIGFVIGLNVFIQDQQSYQYEIDIRFSISPEFAEIVFLASRPTVSNQKRSALYPGRPKQFQLLIFFNIEQIYTNHSIRAQRHGKL